MSAPQRDDRQPRLVSDPELGEAPPAGPQFLPHELTKPGGRDVRLPAHPRRSISVGVGVGTAILFGTAALVLLAPQLFPANDEHLFLAEKALFATLVAAPGGFFGWAVAGRIEAARG
jgi:hypothetical protein